MDKVLLMFPGQGSQHRGMGIEFLRKNPQYKDYFDQCSDSLGDDILDIIAEEGQVLDKTEYCQPAIYTLSCALFDFLCRQAGLQKIAGAAIGHSLGDYSALFACGAYSFSEGLDLVIERSSLMAEENKASEGMMAAVLGAGQEEVSGLIKRAGLDVYIANYNHHSQTVLSGKKKQIMETIKVFKENGIRKIIPLKVGVASHCPLLADTSKKLKEYMQKIDISKFNIPFYSSTLNGFIGQGEVKNNLGQQLIKPIKWKHSINRLLESGYNTYMEIGPKEVLGGLVKNIAKKNGSEVKIFNTLDLDELIKRLKGGTH